MASVPLYHFLSEDKVEGKKVYYLLEVHFWTRMTDVIITDGTARNSTHAVLILTKRVYLPDSTHSLPRGRRTSG